MLDTKDIEELRAAYISKDTRRPFTCPRCGLVFMRKFIKVSLCYKCQGEVRREASRQAHPRVERKTDFTSILAKRAAWEAEQKEKREKWARRANDMRLLYEQGISYQGIADVYGITRERVRQIIGNSVTKDGNHHTPAIYEERARIEAERYATAQAHPELTTSQLAKLVGVNHGAAKYWNGIRHKVSSKNKNTKNGAMVEEYVSGLLTKNGIAHTLTNSRPYDIILANGRTIEIKSRHKAQSNSSGTKNFYFFPLSRPAKKQKNVADFYILVIVNGAKNCFVIPKEAIPASMALGFCWPQTNKSRGKYVQYLNRFDLLKEGE